MKHHTVILGAMLLFAAGLSGCGGNRPISMDSSPYRTSSGGAPSEVTPASGGETAHIDKSFRNYVAAIRFYEACTQANLSPTQMQRLMQRVGQVAPNDINAEGQAQLFEEAHRRVETHLQRGSCGDPTARQYLMLFREDLRPALEG